MTNSLANTKELLNSFMSYTDYNVFKRAVCTSNVMKLSLILPKKCEVHYYKNRHGQYKTKCKTKYALNKMFNLRCDTARTVNEMGVLSDICRADISINNPTNRFDINMIKSYNEEIYYIFLDGVAIMSINRYIGETYAHSLQIFDTSIQNNEDNNKNINVLVCIDSIEYADDCWDERYANTNTILRFAVYRVLADNITTLEVIPYSLPYLITTDEFKYNNDVLNLIVENIYNDFM